MNQIKVLAIEREKILVLVQFCAIMGVALTAPLIHSQIITGPIVNAVLFVSTAFFGVQAAILVGLIPSLVALSIGLLPPVLAPMVPFIMVSNTILVMVFGCLKEKNYWLGVVSASILKFLFLAGTSSVVVNLLLKKEVALKVAAMMSWPQLFTALAGGIIAYLFLKGLKKI